MATRSPSGSATFNSDGTLLQIVNLQNIFSQSVVADNFLLLILQIGMKDKNCANCYSGQLFFFLQIVASDKL